MACSPTWNAPTASNAEIVTKTGITRASLYRHLPSRPAEPVTHILIAEFSGAQLAHRLGKLAVGVVGSVLSRPPHVVPEFTALPEPPEFLKENLRADESGNADLMAAARHRS